MIVGGVILFGVIAILHNGQSDGQAIQTKMLGGGALSSVSPNSFMERHEKREALKEYFDQKSEEHFAWVLALHRSVDEEVEKNNAAIAAAAAAEAEAQAAQQYSSVGYSSVGYSGGGGSCAPGFLGEIAMMESGCDPYAQNPSGATGYLQFMPSTFAGVCGTCCDIYSVDCQLQAGQEMINQGRQCEWAVLGC